MIKPGDRLRVVNLESLTAAPGKRAPFAVGAEVTCRRVSRDGRHVLLVGHHGRWKASRFEVIAP